MADDVDPVRAWQFEKKRSASLRVLQRPPLFDVELVSACNITCSFCPREAMTRREGIMSDETFERVCAFLPHDAVVMFSGLGDALLHPRLTDYTSTLTRQGVSSCVITNGLRLTPERVDALANAGLAELQVSVHGLDAEALATVVTRGADPARVVANLERIARTKPTALRVRVNFVETSANVDRAEGVRAWAESLGFRFFHRRQHSRGGALAQLRPAAVDPCGVFAGVTFVTVDGVVLPCVNDVSARHALGDVRGTSFAGVLETKRQILSSAMWPDLCGRCDDDYRWVILAQSGVDGPAP